MDRLDSIFGVYSSNLNLGPVGDIERVIAPKLSAHSDWVYQNEKLFQRLETLASEENLNKLEADQRRLVEKRHQNFIRRGARLNSSDKAKLAQIKSNGLLFEHN